MAKVLIVAAHPDDEVLGCGGTIARHVAQGDHVDIVFMADGEGARGRGHRAKQSRMTAAYKCADILGAARPVCLGFDDNRMDRVPVLDIVQVLEKAVEKICPEIIYTHHFGDLNVDHRTTHQAVLTVLRPLPDSSARSIFAFEVPSSTEWASPCAGEAFIPNLYVDVAPYVEIKNRALMAYKSELREPPHARSREGIEALARWRGASSGLYMAEAFAVIRMIHKSPAGRTHIRKLR